MSQLRTIENSTRDYLVQELEVCRSKIDVLNDIQSIHHNQMSESEVFAMNMGEHLNKKLSTMESLAQLSSKKLIDYECQLQRLGLVIDSYIDANNDRDQKGGGGLQPLQLRDVSKCYPTIKSLEKKFQSYRDSSNLKDNMFRDKCRQQEAEIKDLRERLAAMESLQITTLDELQVSQTTCRVLEKSLRESQLKFVIKESITSTSVITKNYLKSFSRVMLHDIQLKKLETMLAAGKLNSNQVISKICATVLDVLDMNGREGVLCTYETVLMSNADDESRAIQSKAAKKKGTTTRNVSPSAKSNTGNRSSTAKSSNNFKRNVSPSTSSVSSIDKKVPSSKSSFRSNKSSTESSVSNLKMNRLSKTKL